MINDETLKLNLKQQENDDDYNHDNNKIRQNDKI